ncbi:glutamate 5-kinase [Colletotrichum orchidophilum]|uniref:Glutamate 5-kinase n=1 Tax=Colletotrichum orchidophilum TaxID=1209926 RepID=A0A1G4BMN5_9PEZI|nr:glutamate 5-kinase [Colletotrichum orchidophilum]OHF02595.1 glutamate 5-kinase [Colletotrichum orchidophilum]
MKHREGRKPLTVVLKLGTSSIVDEKTHEPLLSILSLIVETAVKLRKDGHRVVIVSSGAIGVGLLRMEMDRRPKHLSTLQALAAIGQCRLISLWDDLFSHFRQPVAQILLTRNDIADRTRYLNAQNTFNELLDMGVIPIVNENDTLAVSEIKFGDNDTLSAIAAGMVHADMLFLMTDVDCLYDKNPRTHPDAQAIEVVEDISSIQADVSTAGSALGTGGMMTKIVAARLATQAGVTTVITRSSNPGNIVKIVRYVQAHQKFSSSSPRLDATHPDGDDLDHHDHTEDPLAQSTASLHLDQAVEKPPLHTRFLPSADPIRDRHFWLIHGLKPHGTLYIDAGAHSALLRKAGLLPAGVLDVEGNFAQQEAVRLVVVDRLHVPSTNGKLWSGTPVEVGRALVNYAAPEIMRIRGHQSSDIGGLLGYADSEYVAERQHIRIFSRESRPVTPSIEKAKEQIVEEVISGITGYEQKT